MRLEKEVSMKYEWTQNDIEILTLNYASYTVKQLRDTFLSNYPYHK